MRIGCIIGYHRWHYHRNINTGNAYRICDKCGLTQNMVIRNDHFVWRKEKPEEEEDNDKTV